MSKVVLDTCGWLAYFADEPHADKFAPYVEESDRVLVPAIVDYEVHRWALREVGEEKANQYAAAMGRHEAVPISAGLPSWATPTRSPPAMRWYTPQPRRGASRS